MTNEKTEFLDNLLNQCRCCLKIFDESQKQIRIDRNIKTKFHSLTFIELISSKFYSKNICSFCDNLLNFFYHCKDDFTKKQRKLELQVEGSRKTKKRKRVSESSGEDKTEVVVKLEPVEVKEEDEKSETSSIFVAQIKTESEVDDYKLVPSFLYHSPDENVDNKESDGNSNEDSCEPEPPPQPIKLRQKREPRTKKSKLKKKRKIDCPEKDCKKFFLEQLKLEDHIKFDHFGIPFQCKFCNFKTHTRDLLKSHESRMHGDFVNNKEKEQCPECGIFVSGLTAHVKQVHTKEHPIKCDLCGFGTFAIYLIKRHMISAHFPKDLKKRVSCPICNKQLIVSSGNVSLKAHMTNVHGSQGKKVQCHCGLSYKSELYLKNHQRIVHEQKGKKHHCPTCDKCNLKSFLSHQFFTRCHNFRLRQRFSIQRTHVQAQS